MKNILNKFLITLLYAIILIAFTIGVYYLSLHFNTPTKNYRGEVEYEVSFFIIISFSLIWCCITGVLTALLTQTFEKIGD